MCVCVSQGRTHALRHKLRDIADFHFIDAPHILPHYYRPRSTQDTTDTAHEPATADTAHNGLTADTQSEPATADTAYEAPNVEDAAPGSIRGKKEAAPYGSESQAVQPSRAVEGNKGAPSTSAECPPPAPVRRRRAWMVSPELLEWQRTGHMDEVGHIYSQRQSVHTCIHTSCLLQWQRTGHMDEELTLTCMLVQSVHIATRGRANNVFWFWVSPPLISFCLCCACHLSVSSRMSVSPLHDACCFVCVLCLAGHKGHFRCEGLMSPAADLECTLVCLGA